MKQWFLFFIFGLTLTEISYALNLSGQWSYARAASELPSEMHGLDLVSGEQIAVSLVDSTLNSTLKQSSKEESIKKSGSKNAKKATVIVFLSAKCPCSASHQNRMTELAEKFKENGIEFVGVHSNANESISMAKEYFMKQRLNFPVIQDDDAKIANKFEAYKTPHVFVVSPQLEVLFQGGVDDSKDATKSKRHYLQDALSAIVSGHVPSERNVRVLGCVIER